MASTFAFLTDSVSRSSLFRHWTLVIVMSSLLSAMNKGVLLVHAEPHMLLFPIPPGQQPLPGPSNSSIQSPVEIFLTKNLTVTTPLIAYVPLHTISTAHDVQAILKIYSPDYSESANFLLNISNPDSFINPPSLNEAILYGFLGVTITNLCALTGLICIPIQRLRHFKVLLGFMTALAVGALCATAVIVLIPEAMRMTSTSLESGGQGRSYLWKLGCVPVGVLFFFVVEYILLILPRLLRRNKGSASVETSNEVDVVQTNKWHGHSHGGIDNSLPDSEVSSVVKAEDEEPAFEDNISSNRRRRCCLKVNKGMFSRIAPVAWMILLGDGFHNLMDGLTIGVGFTESPTVGIALSLSVLFEELPHELGDFAVLISSGFSIKGALCANFSSACSAYLGLVIGLIIGQVSSGALYVFTLMSGFFLYISLSDMLPSLRANLEEAERRNKDSFTLFVIYVFGLVTGFLCVLGLTFISDLMPF